MNASNIQAESIKPNSAALWAQPVTRLKVSGMPAEALNLNVDGHQVAGALQGFGPMWQKSYWVRLSNVPITSAEVIRIWKENFSEFWPTGNHFYDTTPGITPGDIVVLNLVGPGGIVGPGGLPLISTGIMVIYADEESFTFINAEGHMFAGWITFSAYEEEHCTVAQVQVLVRAGDPLWEIGMRLFGYKQEDIFWTHTLKALARHFGVEGQVQMHVTCVDTKIQWSQAKNVWHNAAIRTSLYTATEPLRRVRRLFKR